MKGRVLVIGIIFFVFLAIAIIYYSMTVSIERIENSAEQSIEQVIEKNTGDRNESFQLRSISFNGQASQNRIRALTSIAYSGAFIFQ
ncbi:hypothetical protein ACFSFY_05905 [Sporosarcina siberiensis]|uniref:Uncharacterized protein n=1 Tax=Sporosarcina siberiensis TaxID=1365606 RepID=A0ABW4SGP2_9BACL